MAIKIYIDQGHNPQNPNAGAEGNGLREQDITYAVGQELSRLLRRSGNYEVRLSRPTPNTLLGTSWGSGSSMKPCQYVFNGLDTPYGNARFEQITSLNASYKYMYSYKLLTYDKANGRATVELIGTNKNSVGYSSRVAEYGKKFIGTIDLNKKTISIAAAN